MRFAAALAIATLLAGCIITFDRRDETESGLTTVVAPTQAGRPTGSHIVRTNRDPDLEGWRQGMDREELRRIQAGTAMKGN